MRLLYVCSDFGIPPDGTKGPSIHLRSITGALAGAGAEVLLLSPKPGPGDDHPMRRLLPPGCPPADDDARMLKKWLNAHEYGDPLARELRPLLYNAWAPRRALAALTKPVDAIIERLSLFGHVGVDMADALDVPLILEVNALISDEARRFRSLLLTDLATRIERRVLERADAITVVSAQLADQLVGVGVDRKKIHVVPNGADVERFAAAPDRQACRQNLGLTDGFTVGFVGSLKVWHGAEVLIDAFERLVQREPAARLLIVGTGPTEDALRQQAERSGVAEAVVFTGAVPHDRIPAYVRAMDVAVAPYLPIDGFYFSPIKVFEYMAAGSAIVASRLGQIVEVLSDGDDGLLFTAGDGDDLFEKLDQLQRSVALRERLGQAALRLAHERYTWNHAADSTLAVVRSVCEKRAPIDRVA